MSPGVIRLTLLGFALIMLILTGIWAYYMWRDVNYASMNPCKFCEEKLNARCFAVQPFTNTSEYVSQWNNFSLGIQPSYIKEIRKCSYEEKRSFERHILLNGSESMLPTLSAIDVVFLNTSKGTDLKIGDIIIYKRIDDYYLGEKKRNIIHRIIQISKDDKGIYYTTQGDNITSNKYPDKVKVREEDIIGLVVCKL